MTNKNILIEKRIISIFIFLAITIESAFLFLSKLGLNSLDKALFYIALYLYQLRFLNLIWFLKPKRLTFQASSSQKNPLLMDYMLNVLFFVLFPLGYTLLHETFYSKWNLGTTAQFIFFILYLTGTLITVVSEYQRKKNKKMHPEINYRFQGLFQYAICINYFGEILALPSLFYLSSGSIIIFGLIMVQQIVDFSVVQIPRQETYIKKHYPNDAEKILRQKKLIPFIY